MASRLERTSSNLSAVTIISRLMPDSRPNRLEKSSQTPATQASVIMASTLRLGKGEVVRVRYKRQSSIIVVTRLTHSGKWLICGRLTMIAVSNKE